MRNQNFGIEIEMTGLTRSQAARTVAKYFNTTANHVGGSYDSYAVRDSEDRLWKVMSDGSIDTRTRDGRSASDLYSVEMVSPICQYKDIETIQEIVRKLREAGAKVNSSCGIHVHVDAAAHTPQTLRNIVNIIAAKEDLLYKALQIDTARTRYCRKTDTRFLDDVNRHRPTTMQELNSIWYNGRDGSHYHYDESRYHCLNLHSVFSKGTVEFRLFNSTTHAGEIKSYIQLCLAMSHQALTQRSASHSKTQSPNEKYTFRTWLLRLGLIGKEFETARQHLLKHLEGNIAWRDPAQAEAQKQRIAERKRQEDQQRTENNSPETQELEQEQEEAPAFSMSM